MMKKRIFEYEDYKEYLRDWIRSQPKQGHGLKSRIAKAVGCNTTYISQILVGPAHLSFEQADQASHFIGHHEEETLFFLLLVQFARAGTPSLQALIRKQINLVIEQQFNLKRRLEFKKTLSADDQATYYSAWYYAAIHVVLSIPRLQTKEALCLYFGLCPKTVSEALRFLTSVGLADEEKGRFKVGAVSIHLGKDSSIISKHHTNWKIRDLESLDRKQDEDLHYSSVIAISKKEEPKIRSILIRAIEEVRATVKDSPEEEAYCYTIDFFGLKKS